MRRRSCALAALAGVLCAAPAAAVTYRWADVDGVVHLSDQPPPGWEGGGARPQPGPPPAAPSRAPDPDAAALRSEREVDAGEILRLAGADAELAILADVARATLAGRRPAASGLDPAARAVAEAFAPPALRRRMMSALARDLGADEAATALALLRSPLVRRMAQLEERATAAPEAAAFAAFVARLPGAPPTAARLALVQRLDRAAGVTERLVASLRVVELAVEQAVARSRATGALPGLPAAAGPSRPSRDPAAEDTYRLRVVTGLLFAYRGLSDRELARYVEVNEARPGPWLARALHGAALEAVRAAGAEAVGLAVGSPPPPPPATAATAR